MADDKRSKNPSQKLKQAEKIATKARNSSKAFEGLEEACLRVYRWFSTILDTLFFESRYTVLFALVLACIMYVSVNISSSTLSSTLSSSKSLQGVTVLARYNSESFEISGLPESCNVVLTGDAANVNAASTRPGYCLINLEGYTEGTHHIKLTTSGYGDSISTTVTPSDTTITLKRKTTATFDISYDYINQNKLDSKYILGTPTFSFGSKVNIRASQDTLNSISMVKALIDVSSMASAEPGIPKQLVAPLIAYDAKGQQVNAEIVPNTITVDVEISSPNKTVPIRLNVTGDIQNGMVLDSISMDHQSTVVYAPQSILDTIKEVTVTLDLSTITSDSNIMLPVTLPNGVSSSEITMVNVNATLGLMATKEIENVPIVYRNNDNNLGASEVEFTTVTVTVYGSENNIENISANDVIVYIDLKDADGNPLEPGTHNLQIRCEKNTNAYVSFACDPTHMNITLEGQE